MNSDSPTQRKAVYLAIDGLFKMRRKGALAVKRPEIQKMLLDMPYDKLDLAIVWLKSRGLIVRCEDTAGWKIKASIDVDSFCWLHGRELPCKSCKRSKFREG